MLINGNPVAHMYDRDVSGKNNRFAMIGQSGEMIVFFQVQVFKFKLYGHSDSPNEQRRFNARKVARRRIEGRSAFQYKVSSTSLHKYLKKVLNLKLFYSLTKSIVFY